MKLSKWFLIQMHLPPRWWWMTNDQWQPRSLEQGSEQSSTPNIQITNLGRTQPQSATLATLRNHIIRQTKSIFKVLQGNCRCCKKLQGCHQGDEEGRSLEGETRATLAFVEELLHPPLLQMIALSHQTTLINV